MIGDISIIINSSVEIFQSWSYHPIDWFRVTKPSLGSLLFINIHKLNNCYVVNNYSVSLNILNAISNIEFISLQDAMDAVDKILLKHQKYITIS